MKHPILTLFFFLLTVLPSLAQSVVWYTYDAAGNRTHKTTNIHQTLNQTIPSEDTLHSVFLPSSDSLVRASGLDTIAYKKPYNKATYRASEEERLAHMTSLLERWRQQEEDRDEGDRTDRQISTSNYSVGSIPLTEGVSPSGAKTYSIPIQVAPDAKLTPSLSLSYNSQSSSSMAGYGWDLEGISKITLINSNIYYHGKTQGALSSNPKGQFALDGVPLVQNPDSTTQNGYTLITASGHIIVKKVIGSSGYVKSFSVSYPNGMKAIYGISVGNPQKTYTSYPITQLTDIDGNRITFTYYSESTNGTYRIKQIYYNYKSATAHDASIVFEYQTNIDDPDKYYAGLKTTVPYRLEKIVSTNHGDTLAMYNLQYLLRDNVHLLETVNCTNNTDTLPPLSFNYGEPGYWEGASSARLELDTAFQFRTTVPPDTTSFVYRRGKFIRGSFNDGLVIYPDYPTYSRYKKSSAQLNYYYGCDYPSNQHFYFIPHMGDGSDWFPNTTDNSLTAGAGFQTMESVDVDGDGRDELVRVNYTGYSDGKSILTLSVYEPNDEGVPTLSYSFPANVMGLLGVINVFIHYCPVQRDFFWGDFNGDGKVELLTLVYDQNVFGITQTCYASLIDFSTQSVLSEEVLFTHEISHRRRVFVADMDGDGASELCHAMDSGIEMYRLQSDNTFDLAQTVTGVPLSVIDSERTQFTDFNADGNVDIIRIADSPSTYSNLYLYTGQSFTLKSIYTDTVNADEQVMFMDVNQDHYPDFVKVGTSGMGVRLNQKGGSLGFYRPSTTYITSNKGILPCNVVDYNAVSSFIKVDGKYVELFEYGCLSPKIRYLKSSFDSFGKRTENSYTYLPFETWAWDEYSYTPSDSSSYSLKALPIYVLTGEAGYMPDQTTKTGEQYHMYYNAVVHNMGLGFCGYYKNISFSYRDSIPTRADIVFNPEKRGVMHWSELRDGVTDASPLISSQVNTWDSHSTTHGKLNPRLTKSIVYDGLTGVQSQTNYTYDTKDFPTTVKTVRTRSGQTTQRERTLRTYQHNTTPLKYVLGAVTQESTITDLDGNTIRQWKKKSITTYNSAVHPITRKYYEGISRSPAPYPDIEAIDSTLLAVETRWTYDGKGNILSEKSAPYGSEEFVGKTYTYDSSGQHITSETDALGNVIQYGNFDKYGSPTIKVDYYGHFTYYTYDTWGNLIGTTYPDGSVEQTSSAWELLGYYNKIHTTTGKPETFVRYDALNREVKRGVKRFDGQWQYVNKEYDLSGNLKRESLPYKGTVPTYWNVYTYDHYNRPITCSEASGRITTWSYSGTSTTTVKEGITSISTTDVGGNIVSVQDAGGTITYTLRDDGQPSKITAPGNVETAFCYDNYGRRTGIIDPSAGTRTDGYLWNSDGSSAQTHTGPNGAITTHKDKYGRTTLIERPEFNTTYTYNAYGLLTSEQSTNGTGKTYTYDGYDRLLSVTETVPDSKWLRRTITYGPGSNVATIKYESQSGVITTETYSYSNGHLTGVTIPNTTVWSLVSENDLGMPTQVTTGTVSRQYGFTDFGYPAYRKMAGGNLQHFTYQFDPLKGNLTTRQDVIHDYTETFSYDALNRLTGIGSRAITYANNGNITSVGDVGYINHGNASKPYQDTGYLPVADSLVSAASQTVTYASFNRPVQITEGTASLAFTYGADGQRVKMSSTTSTGYTNTRYYIGDRYEYDDDGLLFSERLYLGGDAYSAPMVMEKGESQIQWRIRNIGRDYQGSITHIASSDGTLVAEYSYDPWGRLRNPETLAIYAPGNEPHLLLGRGYTGHEHLQGFGLINMNARLYDPLLGRFLSPDPYVQAPDFTQNFNRYSYALNNPLKYKDISGEFFFIDSFIIGYIIGGKEKAAQMAYNDLKIWGGLFTTDKNKGFWGGVLEFMSRFLYQGEQTVIGFLSAHAMNTFNINGGVNSVEYLHGATVLSTAEGDGTAFTLGSYIIGGPELKANDYNALFQHEFGHYLQSQIYGPLYMMKVAIPSMGSKNEVVSPHSSNPAEQDANIRAFNYFKKYYPKRFDTYDESGAYNGWWKWDETKKDRNPINEIDWLNYKSQMEHNQTVLSTSPTGLFWFDIPLVIFPSHIIGETISGLINMGLYNATY